MISILAAARFSSTALNALAGVARAFLPGQWEAAISIYVLPFEVAAATVTFVIWRQHSKDIAKLTHDLEHARALA